LGTTIGTLMDQDAPIPDKSLVIEEIMIAREAIQLGK